MKNNAASAKKIVFLTGTRADFGKIKPLIEMLERSSQYEPHIFVTGMHMNPRYGMTADEVKKCGYRNIFFYYNHTDHDTMDVILSKTVEGFSHYVKGLQPDLIVIHGDRVEALAGAIVGALNNFLTAHIEGGELSGTIDEFIRHAISKMSHIHFVSNQDAKRRLQQMGEENRAIFVIGSPDIDIMRSKRLPTLPAVKKYYQIPFEQYGILAFHPVTTEHDAIADQTKNVVDAVLKSRLNYVVVYPNNDRGSEYIFHEYRRFRNIRRIRLLPSMRFEYFLVLLRNAQFIIGNSSAGIREAPYYGVPTVDIGTRQRNRLRSADIIHVGYKAKDILKAIDRAGTTKLPKKANHFGDGNSSTLFLKHLRSGKLWSIAKQKEFRDLVFSDT